MLKRELLDTADLPGGESLRLIRRGDEYSIMLGANELMNSRLSGSEEALATLGIDAMPETAAPHVLIGGLGMGFTLKAALAALGPKARVTVAELVPAVYKWAQGPLAHLFEGSLTDRRVRIELDDVRHLIEPEKGAYDAILLDVDNGPDGISQAENDWLYSGRGLHSAKSALKPGGVLAIWSAQSDPAFTRRMIKCGFDTKELPARAHVDGKRGGRGARHVIWLGVRR